MSVAESLVFLSSSVVCSVSVGALLKAGHEDWMFGKPFS